jgi:asparagine synthase (glutamine-hydrolysing)
MVFNGEIYNYMSIRQALEKEFEGIIWRGHADTEVLLEAIARWGIEQTLVHCAGMFAFALWDRKLGQLHLARDRMGEKPLYYGWQDGSLMFASELKALKQHPAWTGTIDRHALSLMLRYSYVPSPYSIYNGISKLPPGMWITFAASSDLSAEPKPYWSHRQVAEDSVHHLFEGTDSQACDALESVLRTSIRDQMVSDVPLGAFLSGGIDSSMIVSLMQQESVRPVRTFSIGFHESAYDEAKHAKRVARHLGTEHTEMYVSAEQAMQVIPSIPDLYDEPFADSSQIPTFLVSQMARQHVTVALSGDGGDELLGGYNRYFWTKRLWEKLGWMPQPLRSTLANMIMSVSPSSWDKLLYWLGRPFGHRYPQPGDKLYKVADLLAAREAEEIYWRLVSTWRDAKHPVVGLNQLVISPAADMPQPVLLSLESRMMFFDQVSYLPDDILVKVDRAAMGVSLETRIPFLDHRLVEFSWSIPLSMKIRNGQGKWLLRQLLSRYVPNELIDRPKQGFSVPLGDWLRGPLKDWAESLLDEDRLRQEGLLNPVPIREKWLEHLSGHRNWQYMLWNVLMFQAWLDAEG